MRNDIREMLDLSLQTPVWLAHLFLSHSWCYPNPSAIRLPWVRPHPRPIRQPIGVCRIHNSKTIQAGAIRCGKHIADTLAIAAKFLTSNNDCHALSLYQASQIRNFGVSNLNPQLGPRSLRTRRTFTEDGALTCLRPPKPPIDAKGPWAHQRVLDAKNRNDSASPATRQPHLAHTANAANSFNAGTGSVARTGIQVTWPCQPSRSLARTTPHLIRRVQPKARPALNGEPVCITAKQARAALCASAAMPHPRRRPAPQFCIRGQV